MPNGSLDKKSREAEKFSCWPWQHRWSPWSDKSWNKLLRVRPAFVSATSSVPVQDEEVGIECIQERRCGRCNVLQLRAERSRL